MVGLWYKRLKKDRWQVRTLKCLILGSSLSMEGNEDRKGQYVRE
jgi:hypothetical protein